jgi:hypothetical protein
VGIPALPAREVAKPMQVKTFGLIKIDHFNPIVSLHSYPLIINRPKGVLICDMVKAF